VTVHNADARDAFVHAKADIDKLLTHLQWLSNNRFGVDPGRVQWAQIAPLARAADLLQEICVIVAPERIADIPESQSSMH
jgi:hypothetical protein